jgi:hypothetical protein
MNNTNNKPQYQNVTNRAIGCTFCGAQVNGKVNPIQNNRTKEIVNECRWVCSRCGNLVKIGKV